MPQSWLPGAPPSTKRAVKLPEHIVEVISDSGEGAQRCGQAFASIAARSGNGIWTVEIIPAEIQPPARSVAGASGIRIRVGSAHVNNGGDETDLVVAFNEQVLLGRVRAGELKQGATILLENMWGEHRDPVIAKSYTEAVKALKEAGFRVIDLPLEKECRALMSDARRGKNMFVLGVLASIYSLDLQLARDQIALTFGKKDQKVIDSNVRLMEAGHAWGEANLDFKYEIPAEKSKVPQIVVNGNTAIALGVHRLRDGHLRDVPDHAGDVGIALPVRVLRTRRRHRAPGRGRDRRVRVRDRRLVRRPLRGDDHVRARLLAEAGRHRPGGDGGDSAGRRQRPARRAVDRDSRPRSSRRTC
jgi:Pyruvate/2-oxoacid:ferredoxin oxidoreductase gamma subunit